ncbi:DUF1445 domain-containing protein [Pelagicoccus sp. NFK12]|uniref:DUF1445 domain-containing protein n=1 Tax=Pelagicoccus enzymogenes TaxID=2773457 RepID=A0A927FA23_9BACT|nr:DUF1445 domain-containing protein [Pelagicoccus enzymogenes]MBD5781147.1 DUF1445 domain-containing protein [Pelagicoccus enzymogenes]
MQDAANKDELSFARESRLAMRRGEWTGVTQFRGKDQVLANLVVISKELAYDFVVYCQRNPKPCPVIEILEPSDPEPRYSAPGADLRTDLASYRVFRNGHFEADVREIGDLWREDSVAFLIGSSLSFDNALARAGVPYSPDVWVLNSSIPTRPSGKFSGNMVVTMRWMSAEQAVIATQLTARYYNNHGAPVHIGDPAAIGADMANPIVGAPVEMIPEGVVPVFWACGVTPQVTLLEAKPDLLITHTPAHPFMCDLKVDRICLP